MTFANTITAVPKKSKCKRRVKGTMNAEEAAYAQRLLQVKNAELIDDYQFESITLTIGPRCTYTPDFVVYEVDGQVTFVEVKAWWKPSKKKLMTDPNAKGRVGWMEDARIKIKTASAQFPHFRFKAVWRLPNATWGEESFCDG